MYLFRLHVVAFVLGSHPFHIASEHTNFFFLILSMCRSRSIITLSHFNQNPKIFSSGFGSHHNYITSEYSQLVFDSTYITSEHQKNLFLFLYSSLTRSGARDLLRPFNLKQNLLLLFRFRTKPFVNIMHVL